MRFLSARLFAGVAVAAVLFSLGSITPLRAQSSPGDGGVASAPGADSPGQPGRRDADLPFFRPLDDDEMLQAMAFAEKNMPTFYDLWQRLPVERQRRMPPRMQLGFRLMFDAKKNDDPKLYEVLAEQMKLRDEFISLRREYRRSGFDETVRTALMEKVKKLVELGIQQRELRIERMESLIRAEKSKLENDRKNPDQLIDSQYRRLEEETQRFVGFARRFGPFGGGQPTQPATQPSDAVKN